MSNKTENIRSYKIIYPQIYSYTLPNRHQNNGSQKIGYTERKNVDDRILEQVKTAALTEEYDKLWSSPAFFEGNKESFTDKEFHRFLEKKGVERRIDLGQEWFFFNAKPYKSKDLFNQFRKDGFSALQSYNEKTAYTLRFEQEEAVTKALDYFKKNEKGEFLWNAKPRFGKTLASYDLAKRLKANKVLIVTNRPAIANSWFDDYEKFIDGYAFISETSSLKNKATITRKQHISSSPILPQLTFLSLQDLKGSRYFGGDHDKLGWIADLEWDLLIVDEAHEGVDTTRTDAAFDMVNRKQTLHLSGTPFKALANEKFPQDAIYNWTYLDEQQIKKKELEEGEIGQHTELPDLKLFTYRISQMTTKEVNRGIEIDDETHDYAFDLNEFFRTHNKKFVRENEVKEFLRNLTTNEKYPFSTPKLREELKHTFWYVGNRVESVKALESLLRVDPVFKDYAVVVAAGDGRTFEEEESDFRANEESYKRVQHAIANNDKTITLSCGQLTTGVTVKEWTAVLMLTDIKTPAVYMQAAFRAQNPYKELRNGELHIKKSAYLFDFAPTRVLEIYDQFANGLNPKAVQGQITEREREENIRELLNFFPVISEDVNGQMIELDAQQVLTFPNALAASDIVNARFMTNLLFNDTIRGVFNFPKEVEDILGKMQVEKNKRTQKAKSNLNLDDARKISDNKLTKINENTAIILGEKIYRSNTIRVVDNLLELNKDHIDTNLLVTDVSTLAKPLIAQLKKVYKATKTETDEATKQFEEQIKLIAEEYNSNETKNSDELKQQLIDAIEKDLVKNKVEQKEEEIVEKVQKSKEDEVRDRLRSFTRTIPMFIMANDSKEEITIDNFDLEIDHKDFEDLTSISKNEFYKLRDGFDYEEDGKRKTFQGVFNRYRFNASIAEFRARKEQLANYFTAKEDIFELIPNQKTNQIFTPKNVVKMMVDQLEEHDPALFTRTDSTFIDLYMKSGMYITEVVKKLFHNTRKQYGSYNECLQHILENQVYGLSPTPILQGITQSYIFGFDNEKKISRRNFVQYDITPEAKEDKATKKLQELFNLKDDMKFDAVVGNPPYQLNDRGEREDGSINASASPIYHIFAQTSEEISETQSLIMPARWLSGAGKGLSQFTKNMLAKTSLRSFHLYTDSKEIFSNVDIKGGVCFYINDENYKGLTNITVTFSDGVEQYRGQLNSENTGVFIPFKKLVSILAKVKEIEADFHKNNMQKIISVLKPYGLRTDFFRDPHKYGYPDLQESKYKDDDIEIIGLVDKKRSSRFVPFHYPIKIGRDTINKWKVFAPYAYGAGALGESGATPMLGEPMLGEPMQICTETFLRIGSFDTRLEAESILKYYKTKFLRVMVGILKTTQHSTTTFRFVPLQNFTQNSDIDWSKSISEIDQQLYKKYNLSKEEIAFIEEKVQPMD